MTLGTTPKTAFRAAYALELARQHPANPAGYAWPVTELPTIVDKMIAALERGGANIDSPAINAACKTCKFQPGVARIKAFLTCATWEDAMRAGIVS